jgi:uncharacterized peroxidase-related enzyme
MHSFTVHTSQSAPSPSGDLLQGVNDTIGFVPNIFAVIAESPTALASFADLNQRFAQSNFNPTEREIIQTAVSVENRCAYCVAGHTAFADMQNVPSDPINAVRNNQPIDDSKLEALNQFTRLLVTKKRMIMDDELEQFLAAGYTRAQVLDVIIGICVKTFSNIANNVINTPLDDEFTNYTWSATEVHQTIP